MNRIRNFGRMLAIPVRELRLKRRRAALRDLKRQYVEAGLGERWKSDAEMELLVYGDVSACRGGAVMRCVTLPPSVKRIRY